MKNGNLTRWTLIGALSLAAGAAIIGPAMGERSLMMEKTAASLPPLDRNAPAMTELATFALG